MADFLQEASNGIQPQDNPDPAQPNIPDASQVPAPMSLPQSAQPPIPQSQGNIFSSPQSADAAIPVSETMSGVAPVQSQPTPPPSQDPDDEAVNSILSDLHKKLPEDAKKESQAPSKVDDIFKQIDAQGESEDAVPGEGLVTYRKPGESAFQAAMRNVPETLKAVGAEMRGRIDSNPKNMLIAFQSMYGKDNVKVGAGGKVMFRPEAGQKFRSVDEGLFNPLTDFILFNALGALPTVANIGTQAALDPEVGPIAGGAAGGAADTLVKQGLQGALDQVSNIPQERQNLQNEILWNSGINAAAPAVVRGGIAGARAAGRFAMEKVPQVARAAESVFGAASKGAEWVGTEAAQKLAQIRTGFNEMRSQLFPESVGKTQSQVGQELMGAVEAEQLRLGREVGAIKEQAVALAKERDMKSPMTNARKKISETLKGYGYHTDPDTGLLQKEGARTAVYRIDPVFAEDPLLPGAKIPTDRTMERTIEFGGGSQSGISGFDSGLQQLADFHNRLVGEGIADGGTKLDQIFNDIDLLLDPKSRWGNEAGSALQGVYRGIRGAVTSDRNDLMNQLFATAGASGNDAEKILGQTWKNSFERFSQNQDAVSRMKTLFYDKEERKTLVDAFNKSSTPDKNQFIEDVAHVLGTDSKEYNMFRGALFENMVDSAIKPNGVVDAKKISKSLVDPSNTEYLGKVFNKSEVATLNRMAIEGQNIIDKYEPSQKSFNVFVKGMETLGKIGMDPSQMVKTMFGISGSSKSLVDYMTDKGFMEMLERAQSPEIKMNILRAKSMTENAVSKMKILDVKTPIEKGFEKSAKRYVPVAGPALAKMIDNMLSPQSPLPQSEPEASAPEPTSQDDQAQMAPAGP